MSNIGCQQFSRNRGQSQPSPTPEEIAAECLAIRMEWDHDQRVKALENRELAKLLPDWHLTFEAEQQQQEAQREEHDGD